MRKQMTAFLTGVFLTALIVGSAVSATDATNDMSWLDGFSMVVLESKDVSGLHAARVEIQSHGGRVAIMSPPSLILGWVPFERRAELIGKAGIKEIYHSEVLGGEVDVSDPQTRLMVGYFNAVVRGEIQARLHEEAARVEAEGREPMPPDAFPHPEIDEGDYLRNLEAEGLDIDDLKKRGLLISQAPGATMGNSDYMTGTISVTIFMVESNGTIDPDTYTWTQQHMQEYVNAVNTGLAWWTSMSYLYFDCWCAFFVRYHPGTDTRCQQGYEPVTRSSSYANTWVNTVITNFGYTSGSVFARVDAHNTWQRTAYGTDWAYSAFVAYNPPPAPSQFTDGAAAWAYLGGPYTVLLYRSYGWDPSQVFTHETGHIFYACDEYAESGCGCDCYGHPNYNCENCPGYPHGSCMMNNNIFGLCAYTPAQIGWSGMSCAPTPLPAPVATDASPGDEYQGMTTTITVTGSNFLYGASVDMGPDITVNYTNFINPSSFEANITIDNDATVGLRDVTVYNRDLQEDTIVNGFEVKETTRHYASPTGGDVFPYITPADAAVSLTDAIDAAGPGDSLLVESTTYNSVDLTISQGVKLYGAWDPTFSTRDLVSGKTVFVLGSNITFGPGTPGDCALDGFEIHSGTGAPQVSPITGDYGGAVRVLSSTATIANCYIHDCQAWDGAYGAGGGIYASDGQLDVIDTEIALCSAAQGGGIYIDNCSGSISGSNIHDNDLEFSSQPSNGGGIYIDDASSISMSGNTIDSNIADPAFGTGLSGAGIYLKNTTSVTMDGDVISNNHAATTGTTGNGGGIYSMGTNLTMTSVTVSGNSAKTIGGGINADAGSTVSMADCKVLTNTAAIGGGAYLASSESFVNHTLFVGNTGTACYLISPTNGSFVGNTMDQNSGAATGGAYFSNTSVPVINNIIVNSTGSGIQCAGGTIPTPTYCNVWNSSTTDYNGCTPGVGCISGDPLFVDAPSSDYHLAIHSPSIDAGDPDPAYDDPDGSRGDMGIYGSHTFVMDQPEYPKNLAANIVTGNTIVSWDPNPEPDVTHYAVYKDVTGDFVPSAGNFVTLVAAPTTSYDDGPVVTGTFYKVNAIDATAYAGGYAGPVEPSGTGIGDDVVSYRLRLYQNQPNPFNPTTRIRYELDSRVDVSLVVYDVRGGLIKRLVSETKGPGLFTAEWDGTNTDGERVSTGVYFYRLIAGSFVETKRMVMLK
ncbi:MAG: right-handed parallel beta-helix repeat-containing protein [Candidatus Latescibacterota bacterium]|nr:MAG: right-handed parallel beta-helix repeat-containing protein [Candidatus Latescibacterota bacterium]